MNGDVLDELYAAYNAGDAALAASLYTDGATHYEAAQNVERNGRREIEEGLAHFLGAFPDARWEIRSRCMSGGRAAVGYTLTGSLSGSRLGPFEPAGQRLELNGAHLFELAGGSIGRSEDYWDAATFQRQMRGASPG